MFKEINGKKMAVDVFGEGEPMLLVHGLGGSSNLWRPLINEFSGQLPKFNNSARFTLCGEIIERP